MVYFMPKTALNSHNHAILGLNHAIIDKNDVYLCAKQPSFSERCKELPIFRANTIIDAKS
jgi:hypothetical protein